MFTDEHRQTKVKETFTDWLTGLAPESCDEGNIQVSATSGQKAESQWGLK
jgi:hypothetical protein